MIFWNSDFFFNLHENMKNELENRFKNKVSLKSSVLKY